MYYQDPTGDTLTSGGASIPPLVGYGADSTLNTGNVGAGDDAIPTSVTTPPGATPAMNTPEPSASPQNLGGREYAPTDDTEGATLRVTEVQIEDLEEQSWNLRRAGLVAGVVGAGLAAGAGIAWFIISRRRAEQARLAAAQVAQARTLLRMSPSAARPRLADAIESGASLTALARQSAREATTLASALAESALAIAQEARERALIASQLLREQTMSASQTAQSKLADTQSMLTDTIGKTRDTANTSWEAAIETAKTARDATLRTAKTARNAAKQTAKTARDESKRTAKVARTGFGKAQRVANR